MLTIISIYSCLSLFVNLPHFVSYWSLPIAFLTVILFYYTIRSNALSIDRSAVANRNNRSESDISSELLSLNENLKTTEDIEESFNNLEGIEMSEEDEFLFMDEIVSTFDKGSAEELVTLGANMNKNKIGRMNLQTHKRS